MGGHIPCPVGSAFIIDSQLVSACASVISMDLNILLIFLQPNPPKNRIPILKAKTLTFEPLFIDNERFSVGKGFFFFVDSCHLHVKILGAFLFSFVFVLSLVFISFCTGDLKADCFKVTLNLFLLFYFP